MAATTTWPVTFTADAMSAKMQLGRPVLVQKLSANVGADATHAGVLVPDVQFMLQQTWFVSRPSNSVDQYACSSMPDHVGLWGDGVTTVDTLTANGTLAPPKPGQASLYATLPLVGGPSLSPAYFSFELASSSTPSAPDVLLLRTQSLSLAATPYVMLTPASGGLGGTPWQYVSRDTALAAGVAWGVFKQKGSSDAKPSVFLLFTSNAVRESGAPAALVMPVAVYFVKGNPLAASVSDVSLGTCSAGTPPANAFSASGAAVDYDPTSGDMTVTLGSQTVYGADGTALTWQLLRPAPTLTAKEKRAARDKDVVVAAFLGCIFLAFVVLLMWAVARRNKAVIAACSVVCALALVCAAAWFLWLRKLATPATAAHA